MFAMDVFSTFGDICLGLIWLYVGFVAGVFVKMFMFCLRLGL